MEPMTTYVPSLSLCSNAGCDFHVLSQEGLTKKALEVCPKCNAVVIVECPSCGFVLWGNPDPRRPICAVCRADVLTSYSRKKQSSPPDLNLNRTSAWSKVHVQLADKKTRGARVTPETRSGTTGKRRSDRVDLIASVTIRGVSASGEPLSERVRSLDVSAHGALLSLKSNVDLGQVLNLRHNATKAELFCRVARFDSTLEGKTVVGVEFIEPQPNFWQVVFPPENWRRSGTPSTRA
jgi:PilZ domain